MTFSTALPRKVPWVAVMVVVPGATPVAMPEAATVAKAGLDDDQVTVLVIRAVEELE